MPGTSRDAQLKEAAVPVHSVVENDDARQMLLLQEEVAKFLRRECEHLHAIEHLSAETKGEQQQHTIVEFQCEQQHGQFERAWLDPASQGASMDHDHQAPVMSSMPPPAHSETTPPNLAGAARETLGLSVCPSDRVGLMMGGLQKNVVTYVGK